jgi:SAM-dependent methyltransferase
MTTAKFGPEAAGRWTDEAYADPRRYLGRRAELVRSLGPRLQDGDTVLDLACGDAGLAEYLLPLGLHYVGVDASPAMVEAARARLGAGAPVELADIDEFEPRSPVAATTVFRALYYARDRAAFLRRVADFTERKLVFDLDPRRYRLDVVNAELRAAGWTSLALRPFFVPQTLRLPEPLARALVATERIRPLARAILRVRFTYVCVASRSRAAPALRGRAAPRGRGSAPP